MELTEGFVDKIESKRSVHAQKKDQEGGGGE